MARLRVGRPGRAGFLASAELFYSRNPPFGLSNASAAGVSSAFPLRRARADGANSLQCGFDGAGTENSNLD
jgi:hypothetical protein